VRDRGGRGAREGEGEGARRACMSLEKAKTLMVVEVRRKLL
jgi:hypothetical protein